MEIGEGKLTQRAEQADFSEVVTAARMVPSRMEGEAEASARGSAAKSVASLLMLCTGT